MNSVLHQFKAKYYQQQKELKQPQNINDNTNSSSTLPFKNLVKIVSINNSTNNQSINKQIQTLNENKKIISTKINESSSSTMGRLVAIRPKQPSPTPPIKIIQQPPTNEHLNNITMQNINKRKRKQDLSKLTTLINSPKTIENSNINETITFNNNKTSLIFNKPPPVVVMNRKVNNNNITETSLTNSILKISMNSLFKKKIVNISSTSTSTSISTIPRCSLSLTEDESIESTTKTTTLDDDNGDNVDDNEADSLKTYNYDNEAIYFDDEDEDEDEIPLEKKYRMASSTSTSNSNSNLNSSSNSLSISPFLNESYNSNSKDYEDDDDEDDEDEEDDDLCEPIDQKEYLNNEEDEGDDDDDDDDDEDEDDHEMGQVVNGQVIFLNNKQQKKHLKRQQNYIKNESLSNCKVFNTARYEHTIREKQRRNRHKSLLIKLKDLIYSPSSTLIQSQLMNTNQSQAQLLNQMKKSSKQKTLGDVNSIIFCC
jgi:hypothetical protein